MIVVFQ